MNASIRRGRQDASDPWDAAEDDKPLRGLWGLSFGLGLVSVTRHAIGRGRERIDGDRLGSYKSKARNCRDAELRATVAVAFGQLLRLAQRQRPQGTMI